MFQEPEQTQFDLRFHFFGIPVRVHPWFWIVTIMLGWPILSQVRGGPEGFLYLGIWVACVFVSILVHELGHVGMGMAFGSRDSHIVLYSFGGLAIGSSNVSERWQRIAVLLAGPGAGFVFLALMMLPALWIDYDEVLLSLLGIFHIHFDWTGPPQDTPRWFLEMMHNLIWINMFWGMMNLLPIWPLDGGQVSRELFVKYARNDGVRKSLILSIIVSGFFAFNALMGLIQEKPFIPFLPRGDLFQVIFFAIFALLSWQMLQQTGGGRGGRPRVQNEEYERAPWERDAEWWKRG
jgi:stage IV sporulation protein FB